jgi:hypothetical protein
MGSGCSSDSSKNSPSSQEEDKGKFARSVILTIPANKKKGIKEIEVTCKLEPIIPNFNNIWNVKDGALCYCERRLWNLKNNGGWLILRATVDAATCGGPYVLGEKNRPKSKVELLTYKDEYIFRDAYKYNFRMHKTPISADVSPDKILQS